MSHRQSVFTIEENLSHARGTEWQEETAGTSSGATATKAAATNVQHKIFWATFYCDADTLITITDGATVIWEGKVDVSVVGLTYHVTFPVPLVGSVGAAVTAVIASSSADCRVSFGGFSDKAV